MDRICEKWKSKSKSDEISKIFNLVVYHRLTWDFMYIFDRGLGYNVYVGLCDACVRKIDRCLYNRNNTTLPVIVG